MIGENKAAILYLNSKFQEADLNVSDRTQHAKSYIYFLQGLESDEVEKHDISSRFMEAFECQKIIDKEATRDATLKSLQ